MSAYALEFIRPFWLVALAMLPESERSQSIAADVSEMEAMTTELLELERRLTAFRGFG